MRELPSGTVTLLFTDLEGSTRLVDDLGQERFDELLLAHRRILREAFAAHEGFELRTEGDSFFAVFARAQDAAAAALEAQSLLIEAAIPVRIGIHTGEPLQVGHEDGYVGLDVHRAARVAAAAHGGQVLLSQATRDLLKPDVELVDLGAHRLKDIPQPERLYQLGRLEFPPLRTLNQVRLPAQPTPFLGREHELQELLELLRRPQVRIVTLTGPGGTGKTRLALETAARFADDVRDGVWFVPLANLRDPSLVLPVVAQVLGIEEPAAVEDHLRDMEALLVLDNLEQLEEAAPAVGALIRAAPDIRVLATSRSPLHVSGEREYAVPPLREAEALALFVERARAVKPSFEPEPAVEEICARLDNLPLALELAAARAKLLTPEALLARLGQRLPLLTGGARDLPERQQTLRATIDWSHDLLSAEEQRLFARLSVLAGTWTLETAEAVCGADLDLLHSLVDKSLARSDGERFEMLRTIREYAAERLDHSGEAASVRARHADHFTALAEAAQADLKDAKQAAGLDEFAVDYPNVRLALEAGTPDQRLRIAGAVWPFWLVRGRIAEGRAFLDAALAVPAESAELRANAVRGAGVLAHRQGDYEAARHHFEEDVRLVEQSGGGIQLARSWSNLGIVAESEGRAHEARTLFEAAAALAKKHGDLIVYASVISNLSDLAAGAGDYVAAERLAREGIEIDREVGDAQSIAISTLNLGEAILRQGRAEEAWPNLVQSLELSSELGDLEGISYSLLSISEALAAIDEPWPAAMLLAASRGLREQIGTWPGRPVELREFERLQTSLSATLGDEPFEAAWQEGAALGGLEATAFALALRPARVLSGT